MKTTLLLVALVFQGLLAQATTINIRMGAASPQARTIAEGALVPLLIVDLKATDKQFPPPVNLVIQQRGQGLFDWTNPIKEIYIGHPTKLISWGPFPLATFGQTIVGPIFLTEDVWREVVISAKIASGDPSLADRSVGIEVVGIAVDGYSTEESDSVRFEGTFPLRSPFFPIDLTIKAETLVIRNTTQDLTVEAGSSNVVTFAEFDFVAGNGNVKISDLPLTLTFANGDAGAFRAIFLADEKGATLAVTSNLMFFEKKDGLGVMFREDNLIVPQGTNHWTVKGVLSTNGLPESTTLHADVDYFGEAQGLGTGHYIIPTIENNGSVVTVLNLAPFTGTFVRHMSIGVVGNDVRELQKILNASPDTRIATEGHGSLGNETTYFSQETKEAVMKFQIKNGLPATGFVGPLTLSVINKLNLVTTEVKISWVGLNEIVGSDNLQVNIAGSIKANTAYAVEVSKDLNVWKVVGSVTKTDVTILKEAAVAFLDKIEYADKAFFRLVEKP